MGYTLRQLEELYCTKEIIDRVWNKCITCFVVSPDRIVQEQCCVTVLKDNMCTSGIKMAKDQGACDSLFTNPCETKTTKVCVYLCVQICVFVYICLTNCIFCKQNRDKTSMKCVHQKFILLDSQFGGE